MAKDKTKLLAGVDKIQVRINKLGRSQRRISDDLDINETSLSYFLNKKPDYVTESMTKRLSEYLEKNGA
jgi:hypothetical protein